MEYVAKKSSDSDVTPCAPPILRDFEALRGLVSRMSITAFVACSNGRSNSIWVGCFLNGVPVSRRTADVVPEFENDLPTRVKCDPTHESVLVECAKSVLNYMAMKKAVFAMDEAPVSVPQPIEVETTTTTPQPTSENETSSTESGEGSQDFDLGDARQLTSVTGRNKAKFSFRLLDDGVVTFIPRVGEECSETYIFEGYNTTQRFQAVANSAFAPCNPPALGTSIDPSWTVRPKIDCSDPVWITISCSVSFGQDSPVYQMSRRAKLQGIPVRNYLSSRVGCGVPGLNEQMECATIAQHYVAIQNLIPN